MEPSMESGYGKGKVNSAPFYTLGKIFVVTAANGILFNTISAIFQNDRAGVRRIYTSFTSALAATVAGNGDMIIVAPDYVTALTSAELLLAETNGVSIVKAGLQQTRPGVYRAYRTTATLPQTASVPIFTVTGRVKILAIVGQVTTAIQAQADAVKLTAVPSIGSPTDLCATGDINAAAVGSQLLLTGTLANALQISAGGAQAYQAGSVIVQAGTINLNAAASNTGAVKWFIDYEPIDPGAQIVAA
jgi:hypothetical protein